MAWLGTWKYRVKLTVDSTLVTAVLANFPIMLHLGPNVGWNSDDVSFIFDELTADANRKKIAVTAADGTTECYVEISEWSDATEHAILWVKAPDVYSESDTDFYFYFDVDHADNDAHVGDPSDAVVHNVWDLDYRLVCHMRDDPDTSNVRSSTVHANDGAKKAANEPTAHAAGQDFDGVNDYINHGNAASLQLPDGITLEARIQTDNPNSYMRIISKWQIDGAYDYMLWTGLPLIRLRFNVDTVDNFIFYPPNLVAGVAYNVAGVRNGTALDLWVDGVKVASNTDGPVTYTPGADELWVGARGVPTGQPWERLINEVRVSNAARSDSWMKASHESIMDDLLDWDAQEYFGTGAFIAQPIALAATGTVTTITLHPFAGFQITIESPYGTKIGSGPITKALNWKNASPLDGIGEFSFDMPLSSMPMGLPGDDVLTDGGFEVWTGPTDLTNWVEIATDGFVEREATIKYAGTYSIKQTNEPIVRQEGIVMVAGLWYTIRGWSKTGVGVISEYNIEDIDGNTLWQRQLGASSEEYFSDDYRADGSEHQVNAQTTGTGIAYYDAFSIIGTVPLVAKKRYARCYGLVGGGWQELGKAGIIDSMETAVSPGEQPVLRVSGGDLLRELTWRTVADLELVQTAAAYVTPAWVFFESGTWVSQPSGPLPRAFDDDVGTEADVEFYYVGIPERVSYVYIGYPYRTGGITYDLGDKNSYNSDSLIQYFNGDAWVGVASFVDGTKVGDKTLAQDGIITFTEPADQEKTTHEGINAYWLRHSITKSDQQIDVGIIEVDVLAQGPTTEGLADIMAFAPTGWSVDTDEGYATTGEGAYTRFSGQNVLEALKILAELTGEHFRLGTGRKLVWIRDDPIVNPTDCGYRAVPMYGVSAEVTRDICLIQSLTRIQDSHEECSRVYPHGAGTYPDRVDLTEATGAVPEGYEYSVGDNYLKHTVTDDLLQIDRDMVFPEAGSLTAVSDELTANQLLAVAVEYLRRHKDTHESYEVVLVGLSGVVNAGEVIRVRYWEYIAGTLFINVDEMLIILEPRIEVTQEGLLTTALTVSTTDMWPINDARKLVRFWQVTTRGQAG